MELELRYIFDSVYLHGDERWIPSEGLLRDGLDVVTMETTKQETNPLITDKLRAFNEETRRESLDSQLFEVTERVHGRRKLDETVVVQIPERKRCEL